MVAMSETRSRRQGHASSSATRRTAAGHDVPDVVDQLRHLKVRAVDVAGALREGAGGAAVQAKQKAADMTRAITGTIKDEAERLFDEQKGKAASKVTRFGKVMHQAGHALRAVKADAFAEAVDDAAEKVEGVTDYLEERNLAQVLQDAGEVARRHPGMMLGGMFLTGLALARFLKASEARAEESDDESDDEESDSSRGREARRR